MSAHQSWVVGRAVCRPARWAGVSVRCSYGLAMKFLVALICMTALVACGSETTQAQSSGDSSTSAQQSAQPKTVEAVKSLAKEEADRFSSGDFSGAWDLWTTEAQATIKRDDYVKLSETCASTGLDLKVSGARLDGDSSGVVRVGLAGVTQSYVVKYQDGAWRWQPQASDIKVYALGVEDAIASRKADGICNGN